MNIRININGTEYPCRETLGAVLRFKRETGTDISKAEMDTETAITYMWCRVASACAQEGVEFNMTLMEFADSLPLEAINDFVEPMDSKKK